MTGLLHVGSAFADFLKEERIEEEVTAHAIKRILTWLIEQTMKGNAINKVET